MKKIFTAIIVIIFLLLVGAAGFYFGLKQRTIEVSIHEAGTTTAKILILKGEQVMAGPQGEISWPWYISRASALGAYVLMFIIIVWGMGMTTSFTYRITNPVKAWAIHKYMSISMAVLVLTHAVSLMFDKFVSFSLADISLPFHSSFKPLYLSLGILGFYILMIIILSSLLLRIRAPRFWRALHYLVYPLFIISLIHGFFTGTDTALPAVQAIYWTTGIIFIILLFYRFLIYKPAPE